MLYFIEYTTDWSDKVSSKSVGKDGRKYSKSIAVTPPPSPHPPGRILCRTSVADDPCVAAYNIIHFMYAVSGLAHRQKNRRRASSQQPLRRRRRLRTSFVLYMRFFPKSPHRTVYKLTCQTSYQWIYIVIIFNV